MAQEERSKESRLMIRVMLLLIVLLLIGILTRLDFVKKEVREALQQRFPTDEKK